MSLSISDMEITGIENCRYLMNIHSKRSKIYVNNLDAMSWLVRLKSIDDSWFINDLLP